MFGRLRQMLIKELIQVFRDKRTRFVIFGPPIIQMLVFGYAASLDIHHVPTAILDYDQTQVSRDLISRFAGSRYFQVEKRLRNGQEVAEAMDKGSVDLVIRIDAGFTRLLRKAQPAPLQVIVDASNSNTALVGLGYVSEVTAAFSREYLNERIDRNNPLQASRLPTIVLDRRPWYNPDLSSRWFFVPGVIGNLMLVIVVNLTAFAVVREREIGTLEQIMVTPIRRVEFIMGKTLPFFLIGLLDAALVTVFGTLWFHVPLKGSILVLALGTMLFLLCMLGVGLFISTISGTQQQAMVTAFFFIMPSLIFSGFASPIASMPEVLQWLTYLNPSRYYQTFLRSVFLKGTGLDILWPDLAAMALLAVLLLTISVLRFQKSLD
ncbi:ABC transporter permease [Geomonas sp.]|uniref:ABC transporter permease n=1 Tax=Geomonas sp. TaxID=2651584 RepID=UPI002B4A453B|nr:ABC transporter permease [Geomonas sp.]HJV35132.1 ABC transporter permease [Geomonas sp.]